jgi:hypothetical protein
MQRDVTVLFCVMPADTYLRRSPIRTSCLVVQTTIGCGTSSLPGQISRSSNSTFYSTDCRQRQWGKLRSRQFEEEHKGQPKHQSWKTIRHDAAEHLAITTRTIAVSVYVAHSAVFRGPPWATAQPFPPNHECQNQAKSTQKEWSSPLSDSSSNVQVVFLLLFFWPRWTWQNFCLLVTVQVALDLRRSNLGRFRITPILKPGQKVKKYILLLFITFYNFSRTASYTKS